MRNLSHLEGQNGVCQRDEFLGVRRFAHLRKDGKEYEIGSVMVGGWMKRKNEMGWM